MISLTNAILRSFLLSTLLLTMGCGPSATSPPTSPASASPSTVVESQDEDAPPTDEPTDEQVSVHIRSWDDVQQTVTDQQGKVVVIDVWSTWCVPCMKEFPNLVKLQQAYPESVTCISVAANYAGLADEPPESFRDEVLAFLQKQNATIQNVISSTPDETLYEAIGAASVPIVLVYGTDGELEKIFTNDDQEYGEEGFTYQDHIIPLVESLANPESE